MIVLLASLALAGGTYHPDDVAAQSALFAKASEVAGSTFQDRSDTATTLASALRRYETALDLLGERAPAAERERLDGIRTTFNREFAKLQAFADTMMEDFDTEFRGAVDRALASRSGVKECRREIADGPALPGIPPRTRANPDCQGDDLSPSLATAIDADPKLQAAITEILALDWPSLSTPSDPVAPIGGGARWVDAYALVKKAAPKAMRSIDLADEEAREKFAAAIESGASKEALAKLRADADAVTLDTSRKRAALAGPILAASDAALAKWEKKGEPATGWCANPSSLGGCTGEAATGAVVERLLADKKVEKAIP